MTCIDCHNPLEAGRAHNSLRCRPCLAERNRRKAMDWYNRNPERVGARARAWVAAHRERNRIYQREWGRRRRVPKVCESEGCTSIIEVGQRKFCRSCNEFYRRYLWHTFKTKRRAA